MEDNKGCCPQRDGATRRHTRLLGPKRAKLAHITEQNIRLRSFGGILVTMTNNNLSEYSKLVASRACAAAKLTKLCKICQSVQLVVPSVST